MPVLKCNAVLQCYLFCMHMYHSHYASKVSRTFRRSCVDQLNGPEKTTTFCLPGTFTPHFVIEVVLICELSLFF